jgi:hypothetical protein
MNKPKKPAVVAKTAPKKRGRPAGVRNKPKTEQAVSFQAKPFVVNWEKLAKQLQVALAAEIKDHDKSQDAVDMLKAELSRKRTFWERLVCLATGAV